MIKHKPPLPSPDVYRLCLEYAGSYGDNFSVRKNWNRVFDISQNTTLELLSHIILDILDWDPCHLYEFSIRDKKYVDFGDDDYVISTEGNCFSCAIPFHLLDLQADKPEANFKYCFDFCDYHMFALTVLSTRSLASAHL